MDKQLFKDRYEQWVQLRELFSKMQIESFEKKIEEIEGGWGQSISLVSVTLEDGSKIKLIEPMLYAIPNVGETIDDLDEEGLIQLALAQNISDFESDGYCPIGGNMPGEYSY